jgi:hypothetical protein
MDCIVRNFPADGAKLEFADVFALSDEIDLTIGRKRCVPA